MASGISISNVIHEFGVPDSGEKFTFKYVDYLKIKHPLAIDHPEATVFTCVASDIAEADTLFEKKVGKHPSKMPHVGVFVPNNHPQEIP